MSDKEEKKECKKQSDEKKLQLEEYLSDKQAGQYQNNKGFIEQEIIVQAGTTDQNEHIIYVFGKYLPNPNQKREMNQFKRFFYFTLDELVEHLMRKLPEKYYTNLQKFFIVNPSFFVKSYNFFNTPSCLKNKIDYLKSVKHVYDLPFFKIQFYKKIQNYVKVLSNQDPQTSKSQDEDKKDKLFGLGLDDLELNEQQIPKVIIEFVNYFKENEMHIKEQGIFRKAPREFEIKEMEKELINKNYAHLANCEDPHIVATCFKRFLSQMPVPIFPYKQYELIKQLQLIKDQEEKRKRVHQIVEQIPVLNFRVLRHIIDLLRTVSRYSESNLMKMEALTKIFAPSLIRSESKGEKMQEAIQELIMNPTVVEVVQIIYLDYDDIFSSRTMDEHTSNNILTSLLEDLPSNNNGGNGIGNNGVGSNNNNIIQNPYLNRMQYDYLENQKFQNDNNHNNFGNINNGNYDNNDHENINNQLHAHMLAHHQENHENKSQFYQKGNFDFQEQRAFYNHYNNIVDNNDDGEEQEEELKENNQEQNKQFYSQFNINGGDDDNQKEKKEIQENIINSQNLNNPTSANNHSQSNQQQQLEQNQKQQVQQQDEEEDFEEEFIIRGKSKAIQIDDPRELRAFLNAN